MSRRESAPPRVAPIVIDNGSFSCRAGWAGDAEPRIEFKSVLNRPKHRSSGETVNLIGDYDSGIAKVYDFTRSAARSAFDGNVVFQFETMECILDYAFDRMGIRGPEVEHPVLLTECPCNPLQSRSKMAELLFETYGVPSLAFGMDGVFSYSHNRKIGNCDSDGILVCSGYTTTHVIPISNGEPVMEACCRTAVGGFHVTDYLKRLLCLEYPYHTNHIVWDKVEALKKEHGYIAVDYAEELKLFQLESPEALEKTRWWQLPWVPPPEKEQPTEDQLARKAALREKQGQRLREMAAAKRSSKLADLENEVEYLKNLLQDLDGLENGQEDSLLAEAGFTSKQEVQISLNKAVSALRKAKGESIEAEKDSDDIPLSEKYPLLEIADNLLSEEQLKEKRKQRFLKTTAEGRIRAKQRRQEECLQREREQQMEEERRLENPEKYLEELKARHCEVSARVDQRKRQKVGTNNGHGTTTAATGGRSERLTAVQRERMKLLTQAAFDRGKDEDTFGMNDEDWQMYKQMDRDYDEEEDIDEDEAELSRLASRLKELDPSYISVPPPGSQEIVPEFVIQRPLTEKDYRIGLGVERFRCAEIVFQPSMVGVDQAGVGEMTSIAMRRLPEELVSRVMDGTILLTGGNCEFDGFDKRMFSEARRDRPLGSVIRVVRAADPSLDAWHGASAYASSSLFSKFAFTRSDYEEKGQDWLRRYKLEYCLH
ncbi:hypothetical protein SELMODRAFT_131582 [Selaginella moellendorffii]|uniref:Actin-related protein 5 n=1 Tax=Selaginella moellendorffii TaxID=88036 RepID=D8T4D3_SELML|nr:actin-related protein 5 [Selaginella moellendorffii]XP_024519960.1 actin-related protein 5 [Selaginella moellendorffii]EFJ08550.1 hypothetical protein SELMODRAFT_131582 [Selaginella moellendorffii]|eukprot:XP_002990457.1 actin-related protein 5 [Selaginella moellendorffii]